MNDVPDPAQQNGSLNPESHDRYELDERAAARYVALYSNHSNVSTEVALEARFPENTCDSEAVENSSCPASDLDDRIPAGLSTTVNAPSVASIGSPGSDELRRNSRAFSIREYLEQNGTFYASDSGDERTFYYDSNSKVLMEIKEGDLDFRLLMRQLGILPPSRDYDYIIAELNLHAISQGSRVRLHYVSYLDLNHRAIYLDRFDGMMYRIKLDRIDLVPVCTDGVLFLKDKRNTPFKLKLDSPLSGSPLHDFLIENARFDPEWFPDHLQARALRTWFLAGYLRDLVKVHPALVLYGEFQSGKSYLLKTIGRIMLGPLFGLDQLPTTKDAFELLASINRLFFIDNVENPPIWFEDSVANAITGGAYRRRKLYTDDQVLDSLLFANIAITCCFPRFIREDVASRLLVLRSPKRLDALPEQVLDTHLFANRNLILTDVALQLQKILQTIDTVPLGNSMGSRLADFAQFARVLAVAEEWDAGDVDEMIKAICSAQMNFTTDNDPLDSLLQGLLESSGGSVGPLSAKDIRTRLCDQAKFESIRLDTVPSPVVIGLKLSRLTGGHTRFKVTESRKGANRKFYRVELIR